MTWEMEMIAERDIAYEEGVEKGMERGFERGKIETARENAKKFLENNIPAEIIAKCTGLSLETILSLKNE